MGLAGLGTCCCDCDAACRCDNCSGSSPNAPCCWKVELTNIANGDCALCDYFNKTWYISRSAGVTNNCTWTEVWGTSGQCGWSTATLQMLAEAGHYILEFSPSAAGDIVWRHDFGTSKPSCMDIASQELTLTTDSQTCCDLSAATCIVSRVCGTGSGCPTYAGTCVCGLPGYGEGPAEFEVTIAGIVEGTCGSCDSLNGTYILDGAPSCSATYAFSAICNRISVRLNIFAAVGNARIQVAMTPTSGTNVIWQLDIPLCDVYGCEGPFVLPLINAGGSWSCDASSATCTVQAVA